MKSFNFGESALIFGAFLGWVACTPPSPSQKVSSPAWAVASSQKPGAARMGALGEPTATVAEQALVVDLKPLLEKEFLYGADLQYSSYFDGGFKLYNQSLALGHVPVRFRIQGNELQLIADNRRLYPSEVNHPERLISRFRILERTETTLTVGVARSSIFLGEVFKATQVGSETSMQNSEGQPPRDSWVRSVQWVSEGAYFLQETSIVSHDGFTAEFMESIFTRETLAVSDRFEKLEMDPNHPAGGDEGVVGRYRMLPGETLHHGEKELTWAQHFDIGSQENAEGFKTIDWWVTPNIPEDQISAVAEAVEGWNRYFRSFEGIGQDIVKFRGRTPAGVKLGDPRYNMINWDDRTIAGAAYETQAVDPETGKQSHSLIYLPAAWLKIGADYWKLGQVSEPSPAPSVVKVGGDSSIHLRRACFRPLSEGFSSGEIATFSRQLLKQTLFHEVGHALGLAHNFKGSLSFERGKKETLFSTSIMDYNGFEVERAAFESPTSEKGPLLEYDRQILSALYNHQRDVKESDPELPACNDAEADAVEEGVDPLCIRYDLGKDPTQSVVHAWNKIQESALEGEVTLSEALVRALELELPEVLVSEIKGKPEFEAKTKAIHDRVWGALRFYLVQGREGLNRSVKLNLKSMLQYQEDILPDATLERGMRERAFQGVQRAVGLTLLPSLVQTRLGEVAQKALTRLAQSPYLLALAEGERSEVLSELSKKWLKWADRFSQDESQGLPALQTSILTALKRGEVPFFFGMDFDFETAVVGVLTDSLLDTGRAAPVRLAAAESLASFGGRLAIADESINLAKQKLRLEATRATTLKLREQALKLLAALQVKSSSL